MPYCQMGKISVMEEEKEEVCQRDSNDGSNNLTNINIYNF